MTAPANVFTSTPRRVHELPKLGQISSESVQKFFRDGYLLIEDFFDTNADLEPCKIAIADEVDVLAKRLYDGGKIKDMHAGEDVFTRLTSLENEFPGATILLHKMGIMAEPFRNLWTNPKLLNVIEQLIGPNIGGNPVWNLRPKTPDNVNHDVPWHQDNAYFDERANDVLIVTGWVPLLDTDEKNGCLQVIRGGHRKGKLVKHYGTYRGTWYVYMDEEEMERELDVDVKTDAVTVPVPYGGLLLFSNVLPHRSLPNNSSSIRWSLDLRWQSPFQPYPFHGVKEGLTFRLADKPGFTPDWDPFMKTIRQRMQIERLKGPNAKIDPFDTINIGPWLGRWPVVQPSRHSIAYATMCEEGKKLKDGEPASDVP